jgi:hypothetical protein
MKSCMQITMFTNEGSPEEVTVFQTFYEKQYLEQSNYVY